MAARRTAVLVSQPVLRGSLQPRFDAERGKEISRRACLQKRNRAAELTVAVIADRRTRLHVDRALRIVPGVPACRERAGQVRLMRGLATVIGAAISGETPRAWMASPEGV